MIKLMMVLYRKPGTTRAEFRAYWNDQHGPFFMKNAGTIRAKKYVQSQTIDTPLNEAIRASRGMQPECDGVAEVWFESEADMIEAMGTPEGQALSAALLEDENNFIDHSRSSAFVVNEVAF